MNSNSLTSRLHSSHYVTGNLLGENLSTVSQNVLVKFSVTFFWVWSKTFIFVFLWRTRCNPDAEPNMNYKHQARIQFMYTCSVFTLICWCSINVASLKNKINVSLFSHLTLYIVLKPRVIKQTGIVCSCIQFEKKGTTSRHSTQNGFGIVGV